MYNYSLLIYKHDVIEPVTDSMIPLNWYQKNQYVINFTNDDMISKFQTFKNQKLDTFYLTESMRIQQLQMTDKYWDELNTLYSI